MTADIPLEAGDIGTVVQLSLCAGGLIRTWVDGGPTQLWSVPDAGYLRSVLGTGTLARTTWERDRFREVAILSRDASTLRIQSRYPTAVVELQQSSERPVGDIYEDVRTLLAQAVAHVLADDEYLLVELGGWDANPEPFCLFTVTPDGDAAASIIETSPDPNGSEIWAPYVTGDGESATLSAAVSRETVEVAPIVMLDAICTWGRPPWDLALTFGSRGGSA